MSSGEPAKDYSEPEYTKSKDKLKSPFYQANIDRKITPETRDLLENYSHIPPDRHSEHVHKIRDQAWDIRAYPCTGIGAWLTPQLCRLPIYAEVLKRVQDGEILADVGTFLGHDLRRLVHDGAPSENLYGIDIVSHFDVGYNFFQDREHFKGHFIEADFLSTTAPELASLRHSVDIIVISQVLHQWDWDGQLKASQVLTSFTKPGSLIVGNQIGNMQSQVFYSKIIPSGVWRHDAESFAKLWNAVGVATSTKWETQAWLRTFEEMGWYAEDSAWMEAGVCVIEFVARRIS